MDTLYPHAQDGKAPEKRCSTCQEWKPANNDYFPLAKKDGTLYGVCKDCRRVEWLLKHPNAKSRGNRPSQIAIPEGCRLCPKCRRVLALNEENFHRRKDTKTGFASHCKECRNAANRKTPDVVPEGYKRCSLCKEIYPATPDFFTRHQMGRSGLRSHCKVCQAKEHQVYVSKPGVKERLRIYGEMYLSRPDVKDHRHDYHQVYCSLPVNRARRLIHKQTRRAREMAAVGSHTLQDIRDQYGRQKGRCYYCQVAVEWGKHHVDHVIPLSRGGSDDISNLVIACAFCNQSKNNRLPHEWPKGGRLL